MRILCLIYVNHLIVTLVSYSMANSAKSNIIFSNCLLTSVMMARTVKDALNLRRCLDQPKQHDWFKMRCWICQPQSPKMVAALAYDRHGSQYFDGTTTRQQRFASIGYSLRGGVYVCHPVSENQTLIHYKKKTYSSGRSWRSRLRLDCGCCQRMKTYENRAGRYKARHNLPQLSSCAGRHHPQNSKSDIGMHLLCSRKNKLVSV